MIQICDWDELHYMAIEILKWREDAIRILKENKILKDCNKWKNWERESNWDIKNEERE